MNKGRLAAQSLSLILIAASLAACSNVVPPEGGTPSAAEESSAAVPSCTPVTWEMISYDAADESTEWEQENPTYIKLADNTTTVSGYGVAAEGNKITIPSAGTYVLSGSLTDGQVIVDAQKKGTVGLVLNGAAIHSNDGAAVYVKNADKTIITLQAGTENAVSDGKNRPGDTGDEESNAAIYSEDDLVINGTGSLMVRGAFDNGIMETGSRPQ